TNRGNGYIPPHGIGAPSAIAQESLGPAHDCNNTGNPGNGEVTSNPPSAPRHPSPGYFPATINGSFPLSISPLSVGDVQAFAPCTLLNSPFGGGAVPYVPQDP